MGRHIYSDSESSSSAQEKDPEEQATVESNVSDSQNQQTIRTKAAMKEFVPGTAATTASTTHASSKPKSTREGKDAKEAGTSIGNSTKSKTMTNAKLLYPADLLVVPQRQAAKKASENMRSTNLATALQPDASDRVREPETNSIPTSAKNKLKDSSSRAALETDKCSLEKVRPKEQPQKAGGKASDSAPAERGKRGRPPKVPKDPRPPSTLEKEKPSVPTPSQTKPPPSATTPASVKTNFAVSLVPQRQAAKKAAEQLKSSKPVQETFSIGNDTSEKEPVTAATGSGAGASASVATTPVKPTRRTSLKESPITPKELLSSGQRCRGELVE